MIDQKYMQLALNLAEATLGQTSPNPVVGAVVVKNGACIGSGAHLKAGHEHAEIIALNMANSEAIDATLYVTLEPCCHHGKTPPCVNRIIESGIKRVVIATLDPNPLVAGNGVKRLEEAGIEVDIGLMEAEAASLNKHFFHFIKTKTPYITLKAGISLDGKIATISGQSQWITNNKSREDSHIYRSRHDAILTGINTIIRDNPSLTTRLPLGGKNPIRIVLDTNLRTPISSKIIIDKQAETWVVIGNNVNQTKVLEYQKLGIRIIKMPSAKIEINELITTLGNSGVTSLFIEGGAKIHASFIESGLFNQLILYISPQLIGGSTNPSFFMHSGFHTLLETIKLKFHDVTMIDNDLKVTLIKTEGNENVHWHH